MSSHPTMKLPIDEAPADGNTSLGANNEMLDDVKPHIVNALRELVRQYREEGIVARRHEIRRIRQARLFWQGLHYAWWNSNDMNWHLPYENRSSDDRALEEMPRYQFVTNFYQGFGFSFIAVLSQDVPSVRFYPQSAQSLEDIAAARAASDVAQLIEQNNHIEHLLTSMGYFLWTDGKLGAYVRYVADGQRFGFHDENILAAIEIPLGDDAYVCPSCGKETAANSEPDAATGGSALKHAILSPHQAGEGSPPTLNRDLSDDEILRDADTGSARMTPTSAPNRKSKPINPRSPNSPNNSPTSPYSSSKHKLSNSPSSPPYIRNTRRRNRRNNSRNSSAVS